MHIYTSRDLKSDSSDFFALYVERISDKDLVTFSFDGEKQTPAAGAECCFNQETCKNESKSSQKPQMKW